MPPFLYSILSYGIIIAKRNADALPDGTFGMASLVSISFLCIIRYVFPSVSAIFLAFYLNQRAGSRDLVDYFALVYFYFNFMGYSKPTIIIVKNIVSIYIIYIKSKNRRAVYVLQFIIQYFVRANN